MKITKEQIEKGLLIGVLSFIGSTIAKKVYDKFSEGKNEYI